MEKVQYKGFVITPAPQQVRGTGRWTTNLYVAKHRDSSVAERPFSAENTYTTYAEAIGDCIELGKQIIDGESSTCTVGDL